MGGGAGEGDAGAGAETIGGGGEGDTTVAPPSLQVTVPPPAGVQVTVTGSLDPPPPQPASRRAIKDNEVRMQSPLRLLCQKARPFARAGLRFSEHTPTNGRAVSTMLPCHTNPYPTIPRLATPDNVWPYPACRTLPIPVLPVLNRAAPASPIRTQQVHARPNAACLAATYRTRPRHTLLRHTCHTLPVRAKTRRSPPRHSVTYHACPSILASTLRVFPRLPSQTTPCQAVRCTALPRRAKLCRACLTGPHRIPPNRAAAGRYGSCLPLHLLRWRRLLVLALQINNAIQQPLHLIWRAQHLR